MALDGVAAAEAALALLDQSAPESPMVPLKVVVLDVLASVPLKLMGRVLARCGPRLATTSRTAVLASAGSWTHNYH